MDEYSFSFCAICLFNIYFYPLPALRSPLTEGLLSFLRSPDGDGGRSIDLSVLCGAEGRTSGEFLRTGACVSRVVC